MIDFLNECILPVNLPVTVLLGLVLAYWMMVIVGVLGMDAVDLDLDGDFDIDGGIDTDFDGGSLVGDFFRFMHMGDVPVMIVVSFFVVSMWMVTIITNHYWNPDFGWFITVIFIVPNLIVSLLATKIVVTPFATLFKHENDIELDRLEMIGRIGMVKTSEITNAFGQIEVTHDGPPVVLNARTNPKERLVQGDAAKIISYNATNDTYLVQLSKWEKQ